MRDEMLDPRDFVKHWFEDLRGFVMWPNGHFEGNVKNIFGTLWLDYTRMYVSELSKLKKGSKNQKTLKMHKISERDMEKAWLEYLFLAQTSAKGKIIDSIKYYNSDDSELEQWLKATIGNFTDFDKAALKHTLWQAKRKLINQKVVFHMAPCFWGKQGGGKTEAVKKLMKPIETLTLEWGINEAVDNRNTQTLSDNFMCLFDEMAGLQRVEIEALKRIISADFTSYRPMRTNDQIKVKQNCTFIGISNKSLTENIYDATGLRRFVEFKCLDVLDWPIINQIDALRIWKSIDENLDRGYIEHFKQELKAHQESLQVDDEIQHFIKFTGILIPNEETKEVEALNLYNFYVAWRLQNGYNVKPALAFNSFFIRLKSHTSNKRVKKVDGKERTFYSINSKSDFFEKPHTGPKTLLEFKKET